MNATPEIRSLLEEFTARLETTIRGQLAGEMRAAVLGALGAPRPPRRGRPPALGSGLRPPRPVSAKTAAARRLQGKYLGSQRALAAADRLRVKKVAQTKGVAAGVKLALSLRKKK